MESVNLLRISAPPWWPLREGRGGKCEGRNEKCEFLARESVSSSPIVRIFGKGKCKFIANFSAKMVTSLPSISLSFSVSLSLSPKVPHAQYRKRFRASYYTERDGSDVTIVALKLARDEFTRSLCQKFAQLALSLHFPSPKTRTFRFSLHISRLSLHWKVTVVALKFAIGSHFPLPKFYRPLCSHSFKWLLGFHLYLFIYLIYTAQ